VGTTAFPTQRWANGNTPRAIDGDAVSRIANLAATTESNKLRRVVLLTSVGVSRTDEMPFKILNLFGVLDAKRSGEEAVKNACRQSNVSYSIIRPGRLVGGPYTNLDLAKLFQIEGGAENGVTLQFGDALLGDCKRDVCAEAVVQALENKRCVDVEFSMISNEEKALSSDEWGVAFDGMKQ
jgi:nucleoside-diphosphate-sugar epimerase